jgi:hypothetical protein
MDADGDGAALRETMTQETRLGDRFSAWRKRRRERKLEHAVERDRVLYDYSKRRFFPERGKALVGIREPDDLPKDL